jgi:hypothetical protein
MKKLIYAVVLMLLVWASLNAQQQVPVDGVDARSNPAEFANNWAAGCARATTQCRGAREAGGHRSAQTGRRLPAPGKEQRGTACARLGVVSHGPRRIALYRIVDELDSGRQEQAVGYLSELESPDLLYPFLKRTNNAPRLTPVCSKRWRVWATRKHSI